MKHSPFLSETFISMWLEYFGDGQECYNFNFLPELPFIKHPVFPIYYNVGKTNTKGSKYLFSKENTIGFKNRIFIIYDVPTYLEINSPEKMDRISVHKVVQYPGFRINLRGFNSMDDYMLAVISKKSRYKFRSYSKKINSLVNFRYEVFYGEIKDEDYEFVFDSFKRLLRKRFFEKRTNNNNLSPKEWQFYKDATLPMIREKKAALFVIYDKDKPIAITLTNFSSDTMFDVIRVFDIDYAKYRLGVVGIMNQISWCIKNGIDILDFSKGYFEYKKRWANEPYWFEYHIYYDKKSLLSCIFALSFKKFYSFKLFLRRHDLINYVHKLLFFRNKKNM